MHWMHAMQVLSLVVILVVLFSTVVKHEIPHAHGWA